MGLMRAGFLTFHVRPTRGSAVRLACSSVRSSRSTPLKPLPKGFSSTGMRSVLVCGSRTELRHGLLLLVLCLMPLHAKPPLSALACACCCWLTHLLLSPVTLGDVTCSGAQADLTLQGRGLSSSSSSSSSSEATNQAGSSAAPPSR